MNSSRKLLQPTKWVLIFIFILIIAEGIHYLRNNINNYISIYYVKKASIATRNENVQQTLQFLNHAALFKINHVQHTEYPDTNLQIPNAKLNITNNKLTHHYKNIFSSTDFQHLYKLTKKPLTEYLYLLGLTAFEQQEFSQTEYLWQLATNILPEYSYFHTSLANFYLLNHQINQARDQINYCIQFTHPVELCQEFLKKSINQNSTEPIDHWKNDISAI